MVDTAFRRRAGQIAGQVEPPDGIDLQFIYRAASSIYWSQVEALLVDLGSAVESSESFAARLARVLREELGVVP